MEQTPACMYLPRSLLYFKNKELCGKCERGMSWGIRIMFEIWKWFTGVGVMGL